MVYNIICMKWGTKYGPEYVNKLFSMINRNLSEDFRFICFTDSSSGIREEVEIFPLPPITMPEGAPERGWRKLSIFQDTAAKVFGTCLFLDLDVVIVSPIEKLFKLDGIFYIAFDKKKRKSRVGNSSVFRFEAGAHQDILEYYNNNINLVLKKYRNEQAYLSDKMNQKCLLQFFPKSWCPSFKYHCVPRFPMNLFFAARIPEDAKIILFHGRPEPGEAAQGKSGKWYRHIKKTSWIEKHWQ